MKAPANEFPVNRIGFVDEDRDAVGDAAVNEVGRLQHARGPRVNSDDNDIGVREGIFGDEGRAGGPEQRTAKENQSAAD